MATLIKFAAGVKSTTAVDVDPADAEAVAALAGDCVWFKVADETGFEYAYTKQFAGMSAGWVWSNRYAKKVAPVAKVAAKVSSKTLSAGAVCRHCNTRCFGDCQA